MTAQDYAALGAFLETAVRTAQTKKLWLFFSGDTETVSIALAPEAGDFSFHCRATAPYLTILQKKLEEMLCH